MRKYEILKMIFEMSDGVSPNDVSKRLGISITNIYTYLKQLNQEKLVQKTPNGLYAVNKTNEKLQQILELQAMAANRFHLLITPDFKKILEKMCEKLKVPKKDLSVAEITKIEKIAIPSRIILKISKRPSIYCLKINEALVTSLLEYHDLKANFTLPEFQGLIESINLGKRESATKTVESDPEVIRMCDEAYSAGNDLLLPKIQNFSPDQRLADLLKAADQVNKEYSLFFNALDENVKAAMSEQWDRRYIYNTNRIEGNTMSEKDVDEYLKSGKKPENISKREIHETNNARQSLKFLKLKQSEEISEELIKELHFLIQSNIDESPGEYKRFYNYVKPRSPTTPPQHVKERMRKLIEWYKQNKDTTHPFILAVIVHMQFEMIHPFGDGNGRVGRLLINHILKQKNYLPLTILEKSKQNYYRAIENRNLTQFLFYVLTNFIEDYRR
ncbi:Fic family protein [Candidatus Micrarchaeota archaeon]|nr:Fic family protein [Candidatus Micrarchaeota archaeon]